MRKLFGLAAAAALLVAASAEAAPTPFSGTIAVQISSLPPVAVAASGTAVDYTPGTATFELAGGTFATTQSLPVTDPAAFPIGGVKASVMNGAGSFVAGAGLMPIIGTSNVCLFGACNASVANVDVPFTTGGVNGVGLGGAPIVVGGLVNVTVTGAPWTVGTAAIGTATAMGYVNGNTVQLVTPVVINTNIGASPTLPAFAILNLTFIPEPGTLALLATGVVGLGILGRKRLAA